jgi:hypothetical protein
MRYETLKYRSAAVGVAVLSGLVVAACGGGSGGSSSSSSFVSSANSACATYSTTQGSVYETVGEQYKPFTGPWAAGTAGGQAVGRRTELAALRGLSAPANRAATYRSYVGDLGQISTILGQEKTAATRADAATYKELEAKRAPLTQDAQKLAAKIGLSSCANNAVSTADKATITHVITVTQQTNDPAQCTKDFTAAFVKQLFPSMSACVADGKKPIGPTNAKTVNVSDIAGAGNFAEATVKSQLVSGKQLNLSVAVYRPNGSWQLLGFQNR